MDSGERMLTSEIISNLFLFRIPIAKVCAGCERWFKSPPEVYVALNKGEFLLESKKKSHFWPGNECRRARSLK
ncbi:hypothetical protein JTE90_020063 [Oedothorax gibbosus]|uniref:Uncharacterized protein n=1 Tax=Oedothorax gibbosus TaxID=931172 RepID=A0AAV6UTR9_9ARAC|nr:hypothetical protein JTE90_020063 [Oedothorax gibbosus]